MKLMLNGKEVSGMGHYVMAGDIKDATAEDSNVLSGKAYYNNNGKREGTMPNRGGMSAELSAGGSVSIPEGYHNGEGVVRAQDLASQTQGTAAAANIEAGYTAWVNGEMVEGTGAKVLFAGLVYVPKNKTPINVVEIDPTKTYSCIAAYMNSQTSSDNLRLIHKIVSGSVTDDYKYNLIPSISSNIYSLRLNTTYANDARVFCVILEGDYLQ